MKFGRSIVLIGVMLSILGLLGCRSEGVDETAIAIIATNEPQATAPQPTASPTMVPPTTVPQIQAFEDQLMQALERRDFAGLRGLMGETFMIAGWRSEGTSYAPGAAVKQLQNHYLGEDTTLVFDPEKGLAAALGGVDPLSILGPDVADPRAMYVSGWGKEGKDEAVLYVAHRADGTPYWLGVMIVPGGDVPATSGEFPEAHTVFAIPEADIAVRLAPGQMLMKNTELFRRGSFASYDFVLPENIDYPYLAEIQFLSRDSIDGFLARCSGAEGPCFYADYPDAERYEGQNAAYAAGQDYGDFTLRDFGGRPFFVSQHACEGVPCVVREYTTFVGDTKVNIRVMMDGPSVDNSQISRADALFSQMTVQDDWAGIGAQPGPLYTLLDPGVTLRYPLNWTTHEATGALGDFVIHSTSFVPPAFSNSDQPQVPSIDLFVYSRPLTDTLQTWLQSYSTEAPFGVEAGLETHFFGVQDVEEINAASIRGLQFVYDVMGLPAHELLFTVGSTVVGLSYVDFGAEDLGPAFLQVQSSLTAANAPTPVRETEVKTVLALADVPLRRGPGEASGEPGHVLEGQIALVTGES
jgi:hypothetical protein